MEAGGWCEVKMDGFEASVYDLWILFYEKADFSGGGQVGREGVCLASILGLLLSVESGKFKWGPRG